MTTDAQKRIAEAAEDFSDDRGQRPLTPTEKRGEGMRQTTERREGSEPEGQRINFQVDEAAPRITQPDGEMRQAGEEAQAGSA